MQRALIVALAALLAASAAAADPPKTEIATFAGGCFWCTESDFESVPGVIGATSGYTGGTKPNPTYEESSSGTTGHAESVEVEFDPSKVSYAQLLDFYWHHIDPTVKDRQFCDVGNQYRTAIFYHGEEQHRLAEESKAKIQKELKGATIYTQIVPAGPFYKAEDYHQDYYKKNPIRYHFYRLNCGRDQRLKELWGASSR